MVLETHLEFKAFAVCVVVETIDYTDLSSMVNGIFVKKKHQYRKAAIFFYNNLLIKSSYN